MNLRLFSSCVILVFILFSVSMGAAEPRGTSGIPILLYHRFGPVVADSMTMTTSHFEAHLSYLAENKYTVIPLRDLVEQRLGTRQVLPSRPVVIVVDDGHRSVFTDLYPLVKRHHFPVTLFLYPSAVSHASYAMKWEEIREMKKTGLVDLQSHTFWHPDFRKDREKRTPVEYDRFVMMQLKKSKEVLERECQVNVDMIAWPFGIYDSDLTKKAVEAGYRAGFSIERRHVNGSDPVMALPRYLMTDADRVKGFARILAGSS